MWIAILPLILAATLRITTPRCSPVAFAIKHVRHSSIFHPAIFRVRAQFRSFAKRFQMHLWELCNLLMLPISGHSDADDKFQMVLMSYAVIQIDVGRMHARSDLTSCQLVPTYAKGTKSKFATTAPKLTARPVLPNVASKTKQLGLDHKYGAGSGHALGHLQSDRRRRTFQAMCNGVLRPYQEVLSKRIYGSLAVDLP